MASAARAPEERLGAGFRLDGRYELLYPFAQGGMAVVWVARVRGKHGFEKLVAVKVILDELASDENFCRMFLDEARIAAGVRHPNVAQVEDLGDEDGTLYMVLEWVEGDSLSSVYKAVQQRGESFPIDVLLRIMTDACAGLHAAHELRGPDGAFLNVVHRDVSPQNILVSASGMTKLIDFGVAKARDRLAEQTQMGLFKGKAHYAAPEQVRFRKADRRADLWALGVILYQFLSGRLPFEGKSDLDALRILASGQPPPPLPPLPPHVPPAVGQIVAKALQVNADARYTTALDMQRDLEAAMSRPTTTADVAAFARAYLAPRLEQQRRDLVEALSDATAREPGAPASPLLTAALAQASGAPVPVESNTSTALEYLTSGVAAPTLRPWHVALMVAAVTITLGIWTTVILALSGSLKPAPLGVTPASVGAQAPRR